jgi:hypothetical protein
MRLDDVLQDLKTLNVTAVEEGTRLLSRRPRLLKGRSAGKEERLIGRYDFGRRKKMGA